MPTDNIVLSTNVGSGATARTLADSGSVEWPASVLSYATTVSAGANVLQVVTPSFPLPVTAVVTGSAAVTGTFWQTTQPVSGTFWQTTQPVSGTVTANAGTNLNTSTLALETGGNLASLNTKTPALGQALAAASVPVVLTTAQISTLTPLSTVGVTGTFWQTTQPVSGTVTANAGTNMSTASLALDTSVNGVLVAQASTTSGQKGPLVQGAVTTSAPTYTTAQTAPFSLDTGGNLRVNVVTGGTSGTVAQASTTSGQSGNLIQGAVTTSAPSYTTAQTSPLSLDTAGNLRVNVATGGAPLGQAVAASSVPVVLPLTQLPTQGSTTSGQAGMLMQGAVTTSAPSYTTAQTSPFSLDTSGNLRVNVTASAALAAGTNLLGSVAETPQIAAAFNGTTAVTPQYAAITASSSGATTVVSAVSGKKVYILRWSLTANGNVNANWQSHTTTGTATGLHYLTQYAGTGGSYCPLGIFATATGEALDINLSASVAVGGELTFVQF